MSWPTREVERDDLQKDMEEIRYGIDECWECGADLPPDDPKRVTWTPRYCDECLDEDGAGPMTERRTT